MYLDSVAPEPLRSTAQGLYSMVGMGLAGITSNIGAGWLLEHAGTDTVYIISGLGALLLGSVTFWMLPDPERARES